MVVREGMHDLIWCGWADITENGFGPVNDFVGVVSTKIDAKRKKKVKFADGREHLTVFSARRGDGSMNVMQIPEKFALEHLGKRISPQGMVTDTGKPKPFVWMYRQLVANDAGEDYEELHIWYDVIAEEPGSNAKTDEEEADLQELEIKLSAIPSRIEVDDLKRPVTEAVIRRTPKNKDYFDKHTKTVLRWEGK
ncbi:hypothetical protein B9D04_09590 [Weissella cibaria]|uniref:Phage tail tube protein N-terminal domain-containing protein n=1 Tax=Weissella cibaria TaxID=137591 RepID=A0A1X4JJI9_9LACO|nr:hypothetical protein [Weissella cibaria]OSP88833.1 hypothetical protein B9D04_09590 [Weissella cibaria]